MKSKALFFAFLISYFINAPALAFDSVNIQFSRPQNAPYFVGNPEMNIDTEEFTTVVLNIRSNKSGTARLFWATDFDPRLNEPKSVWFFLKKSAEPKEYVFNLKSQNFYWAGFARQLAVLPENGPDGMEITSAAAKTPNSILNIRSGWQEFWGPRGRLVIGSTINTIQSSNLFGRSIFEYIYWLLIIFAVVIVAWETKQWAALKKKPSFNIVLAQSGRSLFIVLVVLWGLLEISSLFNNWLQVKDDWKYVGKNHEEKLVLANTGDFYPFIQFCEKNIPPRSKFDMRIPPIYNDIKARYYLYPREISTTEADYLVVYDMAVEPAVASKYTRWQKFRDQAYILKTRGIK